MILLAGPSTELDPGEAARFVEAAANVLQMPIDPAHYASVVRNFAVLMCHARLVMEFALENTVEVAPVFRA